MATIIEILLLEVKEGKARASGKDYKITEAHCVMRNDDMTPSRVGVLVVPKSLEDTAKPGIYTCSFGLDAPTYGDDAGKIMPTITGLTPVPPAQLKRLAAGNPQS